MTERETAKALGIEAKAALTSIAEAHGLTLVYKGGSYGGGVYKPRFEFVSDDAARMEWDAGAPLLGLPVDALGKEFVHRGESYRIVGLNLGAPKYPVKLERDGKQMKGSVSMVLVGLNQR